MHSTLGWLKSAWNPYTDYEHGRLVPLVMIGLIIYRFKELRASVSPGSLWGLLSVVLGCLLYVAAYRTLQPRVAVFGLPFILWGAAHFLWGWRVAKLLAFPLFFLWISIPLPTFQQATTHLQLLATAMAHHGSSLLGVETYTQGTTVAAGEGRLETAEHRPRLQRHPFADGAADDLRRMGVCRENGHVEKGPFYSSARCRWRLSATPCG